MKKISAILTLSLLIFAFGACSNFKPNTVSVAELTERENAIFSTTSEKSFVFDFKIDREYEEVSVWIEKYELGELVDDKLVHLTTEVEQNGSIIFTVPRTNNLKQNNFNIGVSSSGGTSSISGFDSDSTGLAEMSSVWGSFQEMITIEGGEVVLADICYSNENVMSTLSMSFYEDVESNMSELEEYNVAYLLKAEFIN
ncbi:hypothetical protein D8M04_04090 [Oceanobacillus piezotolerans]|uniref:Lipoprotein n=1 Tax=Oceanobacillus piezotolerans TaxID=2448030 RepID=A0A498DIQ1_9BACI|nr:hypothetical protein [Oceanobacillus piezotolerans]RLL48449.1 hypothetical protein D8M04_04090 [Oceanobacillus piezotolerans]